jgi:hypothetical protein
MQTQQLREALRRRPFVPFRLRLTNGRTIDISTYERMCMGNDFVLISSPLDDSYETYDVQTIEALDYASSTTSFQ